MANFDYPFMNFNFSVTITLPHQQSLGLSNSICNGEFAECDGLEMTMQPKVVQVGGKNTQQVHLVGPVSYSNLTLKRGMTSNQDLWIWFNAVAGSPAAQTSGYSRGTLAGVVITMNDTHQPRNPQVVYTLYDCLPIKLKGAALNAGNGGVAIEEMQIAYSYCTIKPGQG